MLDVTKKWIEAKPISYRKSMGQYFTPDVIKKRLFELLPKFDGRPRIMEPAVGTGEFIPYMYEFFGNCDIDVYDIDADILKLVPTTTSSVCKSFIELESKPIYDYIITNPPYHEFTPPVWLKSKFMDIIDGRVNIYA